MSWREMALIAFLMLFGLMNAGCASFNRQLKAFLGGDGAQAEPARGPSQLTKFSDTPEVAPRVRRQYKRATKESLADQAALQASAGSLWVMEGQGAYLFSQNIVRLVGDPLAVTLEGDPRDQLQSKVNVIRKLLARIEEKQRFRQRDPAAAGAETEDGNSDRDEKTAGKKDKKDKAGGSAQAKETNPFDGPGELGVKTVPTRIVERTLEGNYRVKGSQPFMIGNREYKIIVMGVVRAEDFNDEGIPANKLLDPKFDIVSARRKEGEM